MHSPSGPWYTVMRGDPRRQTGDPPGAGASHAADAMATTVIRTRVREPRPAAALRARGWELEPMVAASLGADVGGRNGPGADIGQMLRSATPATDGKG